MEIGRISMQEASMAALAFDIGDSLIRSIVDDKVHRRAAEMAKRGGAIYERQCIRLINSVNHGMEHFLAVSLEDSLITMLHNRERFFSHYRFHASR
jgi:hypothetical protein